NVATVNNFLIFPFLLAKRDFHGGLYFKAREKCKLTFTNKKKGPPTRALIVRDFKRILGFLRPHITVSAVFNKRWLGLHNILHGREYALTSALSSSGIG